MDILMNKKTIISLLFALISTQQYCAEKQPQPEAYCERKRREYRAGCNYWIDTSRGFDFASYNLNEVYGYSRDTDPHFYKKCPRTSEVKTEITREEFVAAWVEVQEQLNRAGRDSLASQ